MKAQTNDELDAETIVTADPEAAELRVHYALGLQLVATARYAIEAPERPPVAGHDWPVELDYPVVRLTLGLPTSGDGVLLAGALRSSDTHILGERLHNQWGLPRSGCRWREAVSKEDTTAKAHSTLRGMCESAVYELRHLVRLRALRLVERQQRIEAAMHNPTMPCPPWFELERDE